MGLIEMGFHWSEFLIWRHAAWIFLVTVYLILSVQSCDGPFICSLNLETTPTASSFSASKKVQRYLFMCCLTFLPKPVIVLYIRFGCVINQQNEYCIVVCDTKRMITFRGVGAASCWGHCVLWFLSWSNRGGPQRLYCHSGLNWIKQGFFFVTTWPAILFHPFPVSQG